MLIEYGKDQFSPKPFSAFFEAGYSKSLQEQRFIYTLWSKAIFSFLDDLAIMQNYGLGLINTISSGNSPPLSNYFKYVSYSYK